MNKRNNNLFSRLNANRKGVLDIPLIELIYLIVAAVIILFLVYLGFSFYSFFKEGKEHESTVNNMKVLAGNINNMIKEDEKLVTKTIPYYISKDSVLVGFNNDSKDVYTGCSKEKIERPILCQDKACLCIYKFVRGNMFEKDPPPLECEDFNQNIIFLSPFNENKIWESYNPDKVHFRGEKYEFQVLHYLMAYGQLVLYGPGCVTNRNDYGIPAGKDLYFNVKTIYLEKYTEKGKHYVFIAKYKDEAGDAVYKRRDELESKYGDDKKS